MGHIERARAPLPTAPVDDVEIEHARSPAPGASASEFSFDGLERTKHFEWFEIAFDESDGVGEIPACAADRPVQDDR